MAQQRLTTTQGGKRNESQTLCQAHLRKMQDHPPQGSRDGDLRKPEAQAEAGLTPAEPTSPQRAQR
jgi:hypothetical protein